MARLLCLTITLAIAAVTLSVGDEINFNEMDNVIPEKQQVKPSHALLHPGRVCIDMSLMSCALT